MLIPKGTTAVPNAVFDYWLPRLKPSALCILLIIIRQTLGRTKSDKDKKDRREKDWISSFQLQKKCNYSRRSITSAIETLVKRRLINVFDERENPLYTPEERKGKQRLFYGPTPYILKSALPVDKGWIEGVDRHCIKEKIAEELRKNVAALAQKMLITK